MEDTKTFTLKYGKKNSWFDCHRSFLDIDHIYRHSRYGFSKSTIESEGAPFRLSGQQIWDRVRQLSKITKVGKYVR